MNRYLGVHNRKPNPFIWTASPNRIIEKLNRGYQMLASAHLRLPGGVTTGNDRKVSTSSFRARV